MTPSRILLTILLLFNVSSLALADDDSSFAESYARVPEKMHGLDAWKKHKAVEYDIVISFMGNRILDATTTFEIGSERVRLELKNGTVMVWDGAQASISPADAKSPGMPPRFHLRTWTYFFTAPFKLRDPGVHLAPADDVPFRDGEPLYPGLTAKMTFGENVGDAPDDWYIVYTHGKERWIDAMAYIITYGTSAEAAEKEPHAIVYAGYEQVDGVLLSTKWTFYHWSAEQGIYGDPIGDVTISNIKFVEPTADAFNMPADARIDALPSAAP